MERTEKFGLGLATAGHMLLFGLLSAGFLSVSKPLKLNSPPMDVSLVDDVALQSTAPRISTEPPPPAQAPDKGPTEDAAPSAPAPSIPKVAPPPPAPKPKPVPAAKPVERAPPKPPTPKAAPERKPTPAKPAPVAERTKPAPPKAIAKPTPAKPSAAPGKGKAERAHGSQLGPNFLKGIETEAPARTPAPAAPAASAVGPRQKAALDAEIRRQLKPYWKAPTGADADQLRTIVAVDLSADGSIIGTPRIVDTTGETASNRGQVKLHQELAIKAIRLAAPFKLPADLYDGWKSLQIGFDKRLSQ